MAEPPSLRPGERASASGKQGNEATGVRKWLSELSRIATTVITIRERLGFLLEENQRLRTQVERLSEIVAHQAGQLEQLDKRVEDLVELQVLKRLEAQKTGSRKS
jgi:regulator of replication initiation timing